MRFTEKLQYGRHYRNNGDALLGEVHPECRGLKAAIQHHGGTSHHRGHKRHDDAIDVMNGQHAHEARVGVNAVPGGNSLRVDHQIVLGEHHTFWVARGAAGVDEERGMAAIICLDGR